MKKHIAVILCTIACVTTYAGNDSFPSISEIDRKGFFPLSSQKHSTIYVDNGDFKVVEIAAGMLAEDIERVTGRAAETSVIENHRMIAADACIVAGTWGQSRLVDWIVKKNNIDVSSIEGKWEAFIITTTVHPKNGTPLLAIIGSDRRGYG